MIVRISQHNHVTPNSDVHMKAKLSTPSFLFTSCPPTFAVSAVEATAKRKKGPSNTAKWPAQDQNCKVACSGPAPSCKKGSQHHLVVEITYHPRDKGGRATKLHHSQSSHQAHVTPNSDVHMKAKLSTPSFLFTSCPPTFAVSAVEATAKRKKGPSNTAKWPAQDQNCKVACSGPAPSCKKGSQHHLVVEITYQL